MANAADFLNPIRRSVWAAVETPREPIMGWVGRHLASNLRADRWLQTKKPVGLKGCT